MKFFNWVIIAAVLWVPNAYGQNPSAAKKAVLKPPAKPPAADAVLAEKVNAIMKTQQTILAQLEEIKKELEIVKIRATY